MAMKQNESKRTKVNTDSGAQASQGGRFDKVEDRTPAGVRAQAKAALQGTPAVDPQAQLVNLQDAYDTYRRSVGADMEILRRLATGEFSVDATPGLMDASVPLRDAIAALVASQARIKVLERNAGQVLEMLKANLEWLETHRQLSNSLMHRRGEGLTVLQSHIEETRAVIAKQP